MSGKLSLIYGTATLDMGIVEDISRTFSKSVSTVPLTGCTVDDAFAVESGSGLTLQIKFKRVQPESGMSNKQWYEQVMGSVNRWQARTDGFRLIFTPSADNPHTPPMDENGYVRNLSLKYKQGDPTVLHGTMTFEIGTMYVRNENPVLTEAWGVPKTDFSIYMSDSEQASWYCLLSEKLDVDCVDSYKMVGGMEQPFEYITLTIPRRRLTSVAEKLIDDIIAGRNKLRVNAVGRSNMTVVKCRLRNNMYTVTAYCDSEIIRGYNIPSDTELSPSGWIDYILCSGTFGVLFQKGRTLLRSYRDMEGEEHMLMFPEGTNVWYILQVCAMYLGCKVFFQEDKAYIVDYTIPQGGVYDEGAVQDADDLELYNMDRNSREYARVTGSVSLGDEGIDAVMNKVTIRCSKGTTDEDSGEITWGQGDEPISDEASIRKYKERSGNTIMVPSLRQGGIYEQAGIFARNLLEYRREPQQSVRFTMKEMNRVGGEISWCPFFHPSTRIAYIGNDRDDFEITNESELQDGPALQKLMLSTYERIYPEGQTEYVFGMVSSIDLSSSTSQIVAAQDSL